MGLGKFIQLLGNISAKFLLWMLSSFLDNEQIIRKILKKQISILCGPCGHMRAQAHIFGSFFP